MFYIFQDHKVRNYGKMFNHNHMHLKCLNFTKNLNFPDLLEI